jgi:hypothetical protein
MFMFEADVRFTNMTRDNMLVTDKHPSKFYVVRTVHFRMKFYNDQRNAQVFNLCIYLLLPCMFRAFF